MAPRMAAGLTSALEIRPISVFYPGKAGGVSDLAWLDAALTSARPQALGALLRYFRNLDRAEEAFQEACLRALQQLAGQRPAARPGRLADLRRPQRRARPGAAPEQRGAAAARGADLGPTTMPRRRSPSGSTARTIATTCCACCSSAAIPICRRPSRSRSRCASSPAFRSRRSRAPSWSSESAMEQRITRAKRRVAAARVPFETPGAVERAERRRRRRRDDLPAVQRGLLGERRRGAYPRAAVRGGDPARPAAAAAVPGRARDHGADRAAAPAACARARAARCRGLHRAAGGPGPRPCGTTR